ncbi:hypothetical protein N8703_04910 [Verrucomicrobia bacterium]|nr:hypothetical protein [Verrucomicrobiota bacterium]
MIRCPFCANKPFGGMAGRGNETKTSLHLRAMLRPSDDGTTVCLKGVDCKR